MHSLGHLVTVLTVFASSPTDVAPERLALLRAIERANRLRHVRERFVLRPFRYEDTPPQAGKEAQLVVDESFSIKDSYLVICILWRRMGTPFLHPETRRQYLSGTEYEFLTAYDAYRSGGQPYVLLYRKTAAILPEPKAPDAEQAELVKAFFAKFEGSDKEYRGLYVPFSTTEEFEERVLLDILNHLHEHPPAARPEAELPSYLEEDRRLDVAIPQEARPQDTVELWVKICTRESPGLRAELPPQPGAPGVPGVADARDEFMSVAFERKTGDSGVSPLPTAVEVDSLDFALPDATRVIELRPGVDSKTLVFPLRVMTRAPQACLQVRVKTKSLHGDYWIENSSMTCRVRVVDEALRSSPLSVRSASPRTFQTQPEAESKQGEKGLLDDAVREYEAILNETRKETDSDASFHNSYRRLEDLRGRISRDRQIVTSEAEIRKFRELGEVVENAHKQFDEARLIRPLVRRFKSLVEEIQAKGGRFASSEIGSFISRFRELHDEVFRALRSVGSGEGKRALEQMSQALDRIRHQLKGL